LTDLSVGAQEPLFQIMAACASRLPPGEFIWGSDALAGRSLNATFPISTLAAPILQRGLQREQHIGRRDRRQGEAAEKRPSVEMERRREGESHERPGERSGRLRFASRKNRQERRREIDDRHPDDDGGESQRRIS
jgi:hypothetical protein